MKAIVRLLMFLLLFLFLYNFIVDGQLKTNILNKGTQVNTQLQ